MSNTVFFITNHCRQRFNERVYSPARYEDIRALLMRSRPPVGEVRKRLIAEDQKQNRSTFRKGQVLWWCEEIKTLFVSVADEPGVYSVITCHKHDDAALANGASE